MELPQIDYSVAYIAGLTSFFSPCLLPLLPSYFSAITGFTFKELFGLEEKHVRLRMWSSSLLFVLGFSFVYSILGMTSSIVGKMLQEHIGIMIRVSGGVLILMGLIQTGIISFEGLQYDYAWNIQKRITRLGFFSSFLLGISCALIWMPCVGQILGSILVFASNSTQSLDGLFLLLTYSLGLGTPFVLMGLFFPQVYGFIKQYRKFLIVLNRGAGIVMILFGLLLVLGLYNLFLNLFSIPVIL
jgi:cytochrome c-type biogenesis protein